MRDGRWPFALWTGLILLLVVPWANYQNHSHWQRVAWIPFVSPPIKVRDVVMNLLLYVPWGYFGAQWMRGAGPRHVWTVVALAATLSLATEASQLYSHGRFPSATDLTCNIIGAFAGATYARSRTRSGTM